MGVPGAGMHVQAVPWGAPGWGVDGRVGTGGRVGESGAGGADGADGAEASGRISFVRPW